MKKRETFVSYTAAELEAGRPKDGFYSDLAKVMAKTDAELEADIASDPDFRDEPRDWYLHAVSVPAPAKTPLSIRLDADIVEWFRLQGPGYQTRITAVLRTYVQHAAKKPA